MESLPAIRHDQIPANERALEQNPAAAYLARLGRGSQRSVRAALGTLAVLLSRDEEVNPLELDWWMVRYQHVKAIRQLLLERYAPATVNRHLVALRGVLAECRRMGLMEEEVYLTAVEVESVKGRPASPPGYIPSTDDVQALFAACTADASPAGARDAALCAVLYAAGVRRSRAATLGLSNYDPVAGTLAIGGREAIRLGSNAAHLLTLWLTLRGDDPGALFLPIDKTGRVTHRRLSDQAIYSALARRASQARIPAISPEDLRRAAIRDRASMATLDIFLPPAPARSLS